MGKAAELRSRRRGGGCSTTDTCLPLPSAQFPAWRAPGQRHEGPARGSARAAWCGAGVQWRMTVECVGVGVGVCGSSSSSNSSSSSSSSSSRSRSSSSFTHSCRRHS
eukprot:364809-Chlamydomonas_euryale.AAC.31